ncbi:Putative fatty-acid--CoA ligase FadD21 [Seminavis robusta]|uniref:Fatty-acid--CoA ligase FadD21 n=1 Tax=Seminavis robusta TaxID=568900 RepID=A0A9N8D9K2_9STRA|nr:Putative fatty-acid--CoA ligase FadD21 [Seminavis robusta]|eukprot:Sro46_g027540.1 Putative fatty-acid--CoA ligase FadD21 (1425) ;mRNA; f:129038-133655
MTTTPTANTAATADTPLQISFLQQLQTVVSRHSKETFATWYNVKGEATNEYTFQELWDEAGLISYQLRRKWGLQKGQRVVLCYDFGLHFFAAFLGCLRAGIVAVLVYPPSPPLAKSLAKMTKVVKDCQPALILTDIKVFAFKKSDQLNPFSNSRHLWPSNNVEYKVTDILQTSFLPSFRKTKSFDEAAIAPSDLAFLQYTSGSTGEPKGVMITHQALKANVALVHNGFESYYQRGGGVGKLEEGQRPSGFSWLPQYHDLGLIYASIAPFAGGWRMHMMSPLTFIQRPLLWLELMSQHKVNLGVGPDFAFKLCVRKYQEAQARRPDGADPILPGLDLSCIHNLQCGTEPVRLDTASSFWDAFGKYGLRKDYFSAGYGLAENVVGVCFCNGFHLSNREEDRQPFVAIGERDMLAEHLGIIIVDPTTCTQVEDGVTGEVWISGPSVAAGYHGKPELSRQVFQAKLQVDEEQGDAITAADKTFLRTGDLGFFDNDLFYICGRIKDLIIINGTNYYPQDIEYCCQNASPGVRPGCVASFSSNDSGEDGDVVVVFEIRKNHEKDAKSICQTVKDSIAREIGITPWTVVAIAERTLPKTTSGKIRRRETRQQFHDGTLNKVQVLMASSSLTDEKAASSDRTFQVANDQDSSTDTLAASSAAADEMQGLSESDKYEKIVSTVLPNYDPLSSWESNGMSSMKQVELTTELAKAFPIEIPPDFQIRLPTPSSLHTFILNQSNGGSFFPVDMSDFGPMTGWLDRPMPMFLSTILQGIGIACMLLTLSLSTAPAIYFVKLCQDSHLRWLAALLPLTVPVWHVCFSLMVVLSKWLVVGRYTARKVAVPSVSFLRWWYVDRLLDLWEFTTGNFLTGTPLLWVFYRMMGAALPLSVQVDAFLREFELLQIGPSVSIEYTVRCRKFGEWEKVANTECPTLRFRRVVIEEGCTVRGLVGPGATIGHASHIEKLAAVPEGAQVPANTTAAGSPAFHGPEPSVANKTSQLHIYLGALRVAWIVLELYLTAALVLLGEFVFGSLFALQWRYAALLHVVVLLAFTTLVGFVLTIPLKWILVGRRKPDVDKESEMWCLFHWMADYHFHLYRAFFDLVLVNSVTCNLLLRCLGLDIDYESKVWLYDFPPSKVDLISIEKSMISCVNFVVKSGGKTQRIRLQNCTVGHTAVLSNGCHIQNTEIAPLTRVTSDVSGDADKWATHRELPTVMDKLPVDLAAIPILFGLALSFVPTIEFYNAMSFLHSDNASILPHIQFAVIQLALTLAIHSLSWYLINVVVHRMMFRTTKKTPDGRQQPWSTSAYAVYLTLMFNFWELSLLVLLWGTPFINLVLTGLGSKIDGPFWYFGRRVYDAPMMSTKGRTLVDTASLNGHSVMYLEVELGACQVSGLLHENTICLANTHMEDNGTESGPVRFVNPCSKKEQVHLEP